MLEQYIFCSECFRRHPASCKFSVRTLICQKHALDWWADSAVLPGLVRAEAHMFVPVCVWACECVFVCMPAGLGSRWGGGGASLGKALLLSCLGRSNDLMELVFYWPSFPPAVYLTASPQHGRMAHQPIWLTHCSYSSHSISFDPQHSHFNFILTDSLVVITAFYFISLLKDCASPFPKTRANKTIKPNCLASTLWRKQDFLKVFVEMTQIAVYVLHQIRET